MSISRWLGAPSVWSSPTTGSSTTGRCASGSTPSAASQRSCGPTATCSAPPPPRRRSLASSPGPRNSCRAPKRRPSPESDSERLERFVGPLDLLLGPADVAVVGELAQQQRELLLLLAAALQPFVDALVPAILHGAPRFRELAQARLVV